jgi:hypothetical protein
MENGAAIAWKALIFLAGVLPFGLALELSTLAFHSHQLLFPMSVLIPHDPEFSDFS